MGDVKQWAEAIKDWLDGYPEAEFIKQTDGWLYCEDAGFHVAGWSGPEPDDMDSFIDWYSVQNWVAVCKQNNVGGVTISRDVGENYVFPMIIDVFDGDWPWDPPTCTA